MPAGKVSIQKKNSIIEASSINVFLSFSICLFGLHTSAKFKSFLRSFSLPIWQTLKQTRHVANTRRHNHAILWPLLFEFLTALLACLRACSFARLLARSLTCLLAFSYSPFRTPAVHPHNSVKIYRSMCKYSFYV